MKKRGLKTIALVLTLMFIFPLITYAQGAQSDPTIETPNRWRSPLDAGIERSED